VVEGESETLVQSTLLIVPSITVRLYRDVISESAEFRWRPVLISRTDEKHIPLSDPLPLKASKNIGR